MTHVPRFSLRQATPDDAAALREIYRPYIADVVTFECELPSLEVFRGRIEERYETYPYLIMEEDGQAIAYAYASRYKPRCAYQWDVELSIYVDQNKQGRGAGKILYTALLHILKAQGVRNAFGIIGLPNHSSQTLHKKFGFRQVGIQYRAGYKCGEWHDVLIFQHEMGDFNCEPKPITQFKDMDRSLIEEIMQHALESKGAYSGV